MRPAGHTTLIVPALFFALMASSAHADVDIDLTAIGGRTEADARIAPGKAPVQLRFPGESPPTRILLTPPASVRQSQETPKILGPADAKAVDAQPATATPVPERVPRWPGKDVEQAGAAVGAVPLQQDAAAQASAQRETQEPGAHA